MHGRTLSLFIGLLGLGAASANAAYMFQFESDHASVAKNGTVSLKLYLAGDSASDLAYGLTDGGVVIQPISGSTVTFAKTDVSGNTAFDTAPLVTAATDDVFYPPLPLWTANPLAVKLNVDISGIPTIVPVLPETMPDGSLRVELGSVLFHAGSSLGDTTFQLVPDMESIDNLNTSPSGFIDPSVIGSGQTVISVPEPTIIGALAAGSVVLIRRRRSK